MGIREARKPDQTAQRLTYLAVRWVVGDGLGGGDGGVVDELLQ